MEIGKQNAAFSFSRDTVRGQGNTARERHTHELIHAKKEGVTGFTRRERDE